MYRDLYLAAATIHVVTKIAVIVPVFIDSQATNDPWCLLAATSSETVACTGLNDIKLWKYESYITSADR